MHTFDSIWQGFLSGMALSLMLGTVFFSLIKNSILSGYKTGLYIASGVIICDIIFIALAMLSSGFAGFLKEYGRTVSIIGGIVLALMGLFMIVKARPASMEGKEFKADVRNPLYYISNGFLLNVLNPVNFFSWLAICTVLRVKFKYSDSDLLVYFTACLLSIFLMEFAIAYFASKLKKWMTAGIITWINRISGSVFLLAGLKLISGL